MNKLHPGSSAAVIDKLRKAPTDPKVVGGVSITCYSNGTIYLSAGLRRLLGQPAEVAVYVSQDGVLIEPRGDAPAGRVYQVSGRNNELIACALVARAILRKTSRRAIPASAIDEKRSSAAWLFRDMKD